MAPGALILRSTIILERNILFELILQGFLVKIITGRLR
jgi:hypothetical protein